MQQQIQAEQREEEQQQVPGMGFIIWSTLKSPFFYVMNRPDKIWWVIMFYQGSVWVKIDALNKTVKEINVVY